MHVVCTDCLNRAKKVCPRCDDATALEDAEQWQFGQRQLYICQHPNCNRCYFDDEELRTHQLYRSHAAPTDGEKT